MSSLLSNDLYPHLDDKPMYVTMSDLDTLRAWVSESVFLLQLHVDQGGGSASGEGNLVRRLNISTVTLNIDSKKS